MAFIKPTANQLCSMSLTRSLISPHRGGNVCSHTHQSSNSKVRHKQLWREGLRYLRGARVTGGVVVSEGRARVTGEGL